MTVPGATRIEFPVRVTAHVCANGETWEYRVWMGETQVGPPVFRTLHDGRSHAGNALAALRKVMESVA